MKQPALIIIKPDGMKKKLVGTVITRFARSGLKMIALRIIKPTRALARKHYENIKGQPFFEPTVSYFCGKYHKENQLVAAVFYGDNAIHKCRRAAGATNPKEAGATSIRGAYGRVSSSGIFENIVHVSSGEKDTEREIKIWFEPDEITRKLYPVKMNPVKQKRKRVWK